MKHAAIFYIFGTVVILSICGFLWVYSQEQSTNLKLKDAEIQTLKKSNRKLEEDYKLRGDSLQIAFQTIRLANEVTAKAHEETKAYRKKFESVRFVKYESDSARNEALKKLYKSYKPE